MRVIAQERSEICGGGGGGVDLSDRILVIASLLADFWNTRAMRQKLGG